MIHAIFLQEKSLMHILIIHLGKKKPGKIVCNLQKMRSEQGVEWIGEYPYNIVSVVQGPESFGGGMEYPTITVISPEGK